MKAWNLIASFAVALLPTVSSASFFEACDLEAKVVTVSPYMAFLNGVSLQVPKQDNTFHQLVVIQVTKSAVTAGPISHTECKGHIDQIYTLIAKASEGYAIDQKLNISLTRANSNSPDGVAQQESWLIKSDSSKN